MRVAGPLLFGRGALGSGAHCRCTVSISPGQLSAICGRGVLTTSAALTKDRKVATGNSDPARFGSPVLRLGYFTLRVSMFVYSLHAIGFFFGLFDLATRRLGSQLRLVSKYGLSLSSASCDVFVHICSIVIEPM